MENPDIVVGTPSVLLGHVKAKVSVVFMLLCAVLFPLGKV